MSEQYQILTRPRHLRYIFFIEENYSYEKVLGLINTNLRYWGGRYNPIVPMAENIISEHYKQLISFYDPDVVFYSDKVHVESLKELRFFNPLAYAKLDEEIRPSDIHGLESRYLLSQKETSRTVLLSADLWETKSPLLSYYKINFGLENILSNVDNDLAKPFKQAWVGKADLNSINKIIIEQRPINLAHLAKINLNTRILRAKEGVARYRDFELVIAKDKTSTKDLLYFWNRHLYECRNILYVTLEELELLCADPYFGEVLRQMAGESDVDVVSDSLSDAEIARLIKEKLQKASIYKRFKHKVIAQFPFEILDADGLFEREYGEEVSFQPVPAKGGLIQIPKLSFTDKVGFYSQEWVIDIEEKMPDEGYLNSVLYPFTANGHVGDLKGRVNRRNNLSVIINSQLNTSPVIKSNIPKFTDAARQLIQRPFIDGEAVESKFVGIGYGDQSNRLRAFLRLFNEDLDAMNEFFRDKFWVDIFEKLSTSDKAAGDCITFSEIKATCIEALKENGIVLGNREETRRNEENLIIGLKKTVGELCGYKVTIKGFKLKCTTCSSIHWYHIEEVSETVKCKGCLQQFTLPVEPEFAYKLNDLVRNNIYQTNKSRDGNLTVARTLAALKASARTSFNFTAQLNLFTDDHHTKPEADIDIFCTLDGVLVIGEGKHSSTAFFDDSMKALKSLVEIAQQIRPGRIVFSCYDDASDKLAKAKRSLERLFDNWAFAPEIETMALSAPRYNLNSYRYFYH